jgi:choline dehydrogenase
VQWRCEGDVILSAGSLQSPQLLQLSGIGPADLLRAAGVSVVHESPEVGENLQDHYQARTIVRLKHPVSLNDQVRSPWGLATMGLQWALSARGPLTGGGGTGRRIRLHVAGAGRAGRHPVQRHAAVGG